jgi:hypothetical protein
MAEPVAKPQSRLQPIRLPLREIKAGDVLLKWGAVLPVSVRLDFRRVGDWNVIANEEGATLGRRLTDAGWSFFFIVPAIESTAVGLHPHRTLMRALNGIFRQLEEKGFNAVEIVNVRKNRRFGIYSVRITAHPRHVRKGPYIQDPDPHHYPTRLWDSSRILTVRDRRTRQLKAI